MFHRLLGAAPGEAGAGGHYRGPDSSRWGGTEAEEERVRLGGGGRAAGSIVRQA